MAIDLGDTPTGTPPSAPEKAQMRTALGVGSTDSPAFAAVVLGASGNLAGGTNGIFQRNSTNAQNFYVANTYTDSSNYERGVFGFAGNILRIGTEKLGTGSARPLQLMTDGTSRMNISATGTITGVSDFTADYLRAGALIKTNFDLIFGASNWVYVSAPASNVLTLKGDSGADTFARLQFAGTTSSYPAIKRSGVTLEARLADDSGYAATQSLYQRFGTGTPEGAVTAPIGAVFHRTDGGAVTSLYVKESGAGNTGWVAK